MIGQYDLIGQMGPCILRLTIINVCKINSRYWCMWYNIHKLKLKTDTTSNSTTDTKSFGQSMI